MKQAAHHAIGREIRPQRLFVEIVERGALLFGVVGHVPGLQLRRLGAFDGAPKFQQLAVLFVEARFGLGLEIPQERQRARAAPGHAVFENQIGKVAKTEQAGLLRAQFQDAADQRPVVPGALRGADAICQIHLPANGGVVQVGHDGGVIGRLQSEPPAFAAFAGGALARGSHGGGRQSRQGGLILDHQFEGVGGIEHVLTELGGDLS